MKCPINNCQGIANPLMCDVHWRKVSPQRQRKIKFLWVQVCRYGQHHSEKLYIAQKEAIDFLNEWEQEVCKN